MVCEIVGTRRVDKKDDKGDMHGYSVFVTHDEVGVMGVLAEKTFVRDDWINQHLGGWVPNPGDMCEASFNRFGKLVIDAPIS